MKENISDWIIERNHQYLILNKPAGIPTQSDKTNDADLLTATQAYAKSDLKLINRLDRPVSGCVILAKSKNATVHLSNSKKIVKTYLAIVEPTLPKESDDLVAYLTKGTTNKAYLSEVEKEGYRKAEMSYKLIHTFDKYQLVEIELHSGRNRIIRRMIEHLGYKVTKLDRVQFAGLTKKDIPRGRFRHLSEKEVGLMHRVCGLIPQDKE